MTPRIGEAELKRAYAATAEGMGPGTTVEEYVRSCGFDEGALAIFTAASAAGAIASGRSIGAAPEEMVIVAFTRGLFVGLELAREVKP